jgi:hypothetical protein
VPRLEELEVRLTPDTTIVTSLAHVDPPPPGKVTLRSAIGSGATSITFDPSVSGNIYLTSQLDINETVSISNNNPGTSIDLIGNGTFGLIETEDGTDVEIDNLYFEQGGGVNQGGGILNQGSLTLNGCYMRLCSTSGATGGGGAICNLGTLTLENTTLTENTSYNGGAIDNQPLGQVNILTGTVIESNNATSGGGGIANFGTVTIGDNVVVNDNSSGGVGGGIYNAGTLTMGQSSLTYNHADNKGGGLFTTEGTAKLTGTDIEQNQATNAAGEGGGFYLDSGSLTLDGCTLSNNTAPLGNGGAYHKPAAPVLIGGTITDQVVPDN